MRRFLVTPDSFKGTFDAAAVAGAIGGGIEAAGGEADRCPVADGGEGTMAVLLGALGGERRSARVQDPLRRPVEASFALLGDGEIAVVEAARASGLPLLAPQEREPERADTYGTGELIGAAIAGGARRVLVAAGGSATTDGGRGAIEALRESKAAFVLCSSSGEQKTNAGADFVLDALDFESRLARADAVVSGEGRFDSQSLEGKVVGAIAERCTVAGKPLHLVVGQNGLDAAAAAGVTSIAEATDLEAIRQAAAALAVEP